MYTHSKTGTTQGITVPFPAHSSRNSHFEMQDAYSQLFYPYIRL